MAAVDREAERRGGGSGCCEDGHHTLPQRQKPPRAKYSALLQASPHTEGRAKRWRGRAGGDALDPNSTQGRQRGARSLLQPSASSMQDGQLWWSEVNFGAPGLIGGAAKGAPAVIVIQEGWKNSSGHKRRILVNKIGEFLWTLSKNSREHFCPLEFLFWGDFSWTLFW